MSLKYKVGDILETKTGKIEIIDRIKRGESFLVKYKCLTCGYVDEKHISNIKKRTGCRLCQNQITVKGINDMWTTNPYMASLLENPDDGYKYMQCSGKRVNWKCPKCGKIKKNIAISQVYCEGKISCRFCSDGISYPNKLMMSLLQSLNIEFEREFSPNWFGKRKRFYDFRFFYNNAKYIVEMDGGLGHGYKNTPYSTASEQLAIDLQKDNAAKERGYDIIRINCNYIKTESAFEYIKENILNSELNDIFELTGINWEEIKKEIESSNVKIASWLFNNEIQGMKEIGEILKVSPVTVSRYLKRGNSIGLCDYTSEKRYRHDYGENSKHKVKATNLVTKEEKIFDSVFMAAETCGVHRASISKCCNGKFSSVRGYEFSYYK